MSKERIYPLKEGDKENLYRHYARYRFAKMFIKQDSIVLDCSTGSGYGIEFIRHNIKEIVGVDNSELALKYASTFHKYPKVTYMFKDIKDLTFKKNSFDAIISFETLEYIPEQLAINFLNDIKKWLRPEGIFICSFDMVRFKEEDHPLINKYHLNRMSREKMMEMFNTIFNDYDKIFFHQTEQIFQPLQNERHGICIMVAKRRING